MLVMTGSFEMKSMYEQNVDLVHEEQYAMQCILPPVVNSFMKLVNAEQVLCLCNYFDPKQPS